MENFFGLGVSLIVLAGIGCLYFVYLAFKKTLVFNAAVVFVSLIDMCACFGFIVGVKGLIHLTWTVPIGISLILFGFIYLAKYVKDPVVFLNTSIKELANGNVDLEVPEKMMQRNQEIGAISRSLQELVNIQGNILKELSATSGSLDDVSTHVSSGSCQLSEGANEQAAAVEKVSSSMEEMVGNIYSSMENASITERVAIEMLSEFKKSNQIIEEAVRSIRQIDDQVSAISAIAQQTNILALNATIEASQAGEYGRGFAVVAGEVRKLAEQSKLAAEKIEDLSEVGVRSISNVKAAMEDIMPKIAKTTDLVKEISASSQEQRQGVDQINSSIVLLNSVVQQNAASAEELSASSIELVGFAKRLRKLMAFFSFQGKEVGAFKDDTKMMKRA